MELFLAAKAASRMKKKEPEKKPFPGIRGKAEGSPGKHIGPGVSPLESMINSNLPVMKSLVNKVVTGEAGKGLQDPNALKAMLKLADNEQKMALTQMQIEGARMQNEATERQQVWEKQRNDDNVRLMMGLMAAGQAPQQLNRPIPAGAEGVPTQADVAQLQVQGQQFLEPLATKVALKAKELEDTKKIADMQNTQHYFNTMFTGAVNQDMAEQQRESIKEYRQWQAETEFKQRKELMGLTQNFKDEAKMQSELLKATKDRYEKGIGGSQVVSPKKVQANVTSFMESYGGFEEESALLASGWIGGKNPAPPEKLQEYLMSEVQKGNLNPYTATAIMYKYYPEYMMNLENGEEVTL